MSKGTLGKLFKRVYQMVIYLPEEVLQKGMKLRPKNEQIIYAGIAFFDWLCQFS